MGQKELLNSCTNKIQRNATIANLENSTLISNHYIRNMIVLCSTPSMDTRSNRPYVYDIVKDTLQQYFEGNH
jgi:hypothetical protein